MNASTEIGREWLRRMIALLCSLADLAEQASVCSWRMRRHVLAYLRSFEISAFRSVGHAAQTLGAPVPHSAMIAARVDMAPDGGDDDRYDPADAIDLASRFRALAAALVLLLVLAQQLAGAVHPAVRVGAGNSVFASGPTSSPVAVATNVAAIRAPPFLAT